MGTRHLLAVLVLASSLWGVSATDFVGCGGFVKAGPELARLRQADDPKVDYSIIKVELATPEGLVKYSTECSPNGYYFIPVYDKGEAVIRVKGPEGWSFNPAERAVAVDKDCSEDVNFDYTGFSITGRVEGATGAASCPGGGAGPVGVTISLTPVGKEGMEPLATETGPGGVYRFENLPTGVFQISASHPSWTISGEPAVVELGWGSVQVPDSFRVSGYDVSGRVTSEGNPVVGVHFYLYSDEVASIRCPQAASVTEGPLPGAKPLCRAVSDKGGVFQFAAVPCGRYTVVPKYQGETTVFDVSPNQLELRVGHGSTKIGTVFQVRGFSVSGSVVTDKGEPVAGAAVLVDGQQRAVTGGDGRYNLDQVTSSLTYTITASKDLYVFQPLHKFRILPSSASLPDIRATAYHVCGSVQAPADPRFSSSRRQVALTHGPPDVPPKTEMVDPKTGAFCFTAPPGDYRISPVVTPKERAAGLLFSPRHRDISVAGGPVLGLDFSQSRVSLSGAVRCLEGLCGAGLEATLSPDGGSGVGRSGGGQVLKQPVSEEGSFRFEGLFPGKYTLSVAVDGKRGAWCWEAGMVEVDVGGEDVTGVAMRQKGYVLEVVSSHGVEVLVTADGGGIEPLKLTLSKGSQTVCLQAPGMYTLSFPSPCIYFGSPTFAFHTARAQPLVLEATHLLVRGAVAVNVGEKDSTAIGGDLKMSVGPAGRPTEPPEVLSTTLAPSSASTPSSLTTFSYSTWARPGAPLTLVPSHPDLLFYPRVRNVTVPPFETQSCPDPFPSFEGGSGVIIEGEIHPAEEGVLVQVTYASASRAAEAVEGDVAATVLTRSDGRYAIRPLYSDATYKVIASKPGFHFRPLPSGTNPWSFEGLRLGSVVASVHAGQGAEAPLPSVLLSLSGGEGFRKNAGTGDGGRRLFTDLFPGTYYLRPVLKEYTFEPPSAEIQVGSGQEAATAFTAHRVAYSVSGSVRLLNGAPAGSVVLEARHKDGALVEEANSDSEGRYRLRGLEPGIEYSVAVKAETGQVERASPASTSFLMDPADRTGLHFLVLERPSGCSITGTAKGPEAWRPHVMVEIVRVDSAQRVERAIPLPYSQFFEVIGLERGARYIVRLGFTLPDRTHTFSSSPAIVEVDLSGPACYGTHVGELVFSASERSDKLEPVPPNFVPFLIAVLAVAAIANFSWLQGLAGAQLTAQSSQPPTAPLGVVPGMLPSTKKRDAIVKRRTRV